MKLEDKFFNSFFYQFLLCVFLSGFVLIGFIVTCTNNNIDKIVYTNIINLEKKYSKININSANVLISTTLLKYQSSLNELIYSYQNISYKILSSKRNYTFRSNILKCILNLPFDYCNMNKQKLNHIGIWLLDEIIDDNTINDDNNNDVKNQLVALNGIIPNLDTVFEATKSSTLTFYFYFVNTELYCSYPISRDCETNFFYINNINEYETISCLNPNGEFYKVYKMKCESLYSNILKSRTGSFDNNYSKQNKTIFLDNNYEFLFNEIKGFSMCIEFNDPITQGKAYACTDAYNTELIFGLENLNSNMPGYFLVSNIGYNNDFYYPSGEVKSKSSVENIFKWDIKYNLVEKAQFHDNIRKILSSNYIEYINNNSIYDEVFVNGHNSSGQYFYLNGEKLEYSIYPIVLYNINRQKEHILSIIYIHINKSFISKFESINSSIMLNIILELILIAIFGSGLLYLIYLTFNILVKYISIPIKNVNYMLKGINIGGKNRLSYIDFLHRIQDENLEKLEKIYIFENNNMNDLSNESTNDLIDNIKNKKHNKNYNGKENLINKDSQENNNKKLNLYSNFNKKYDEESSYILNEYNFYDFDEQLLQYRSFEIDHLINSLMDLKNAFIIISNDRKVEQIINYSYSEEIFREFKNKENAIICESNMGNIQSQLLKFDKAIFHLVLSLQDNKLKKFLKRNLTDEFDENDTLLKKISNIFNKEKIKEKSNILIQKQQNVNKEEFSQKLLGILINTRYCKLISAYYMFFKNIQKLNKTNKTIKEQYINTIFHTINYYHKILIQYIFLCYIKNDLVKIGESILDYIEFLIKFKFKTSKNDKYFLKTNSPSNTKIIKKQEFKKKIFNKIINWFQIFDNYIKYTKKNSSISDIKNILDYYSKFENSESTNSNLNLENQSIFMFRINIQKGDFLKAKFALYCKNYNDALFYFIRASQKKSIILDGLIKKRSIKHINKLLIKLGKKYENLGLKNLCMEKELKEFLDEKNLLKRSTNITQNEKITFGEEIENIKYSIQNVINSFNKKQGKDIIILIDFNNYSKKDDNIESKTYKIDRFIEQTIVILKNFLSSNDRFSLFIFDNHYKIFCPLINVNEIDINSFSKDLIQFKNSAFDKIEEINFDTKLKEFKCIEFNLKEDNLSENSQEDSLEISDKEKNFNYSYNTIISGFVKTINYINYYLQMKENVKNEKYMIIFTDILNIQFTNDQDKVEKIFENLNKNRNIIIILVGKSNKEIQHTKKYFFAEILEELVLSKFNEKSEVINFDNMKRIKTILSNNNIIIDEIDNPN